MINYKIVSDSYLVTNKIEGMKTKLILTLSMILVFDMKMEGQVQDWKWAKSASGNNSDQASAVTSDSWGNTIVAGSFTSDSIVFGSIVLHNRVPENADIFIAKYDADGNLLWAKSFGGIDNDKAYSLISDDSGNTYMAANFYSQSIQVDTFNFVNAGNVGDILLVKFDSLGIVKWAKREGGPGLEIPYTIQVDKSGNIIVAGRFSSQSVSFGEFTLKQAGSMDVFVVKYNSDGNVLWAKGFGGTSNDEAYSLDTDDAGNIYVAGYFNSNISFGNYALKTSGQADGFLTKLSPEGDVLWAENTGGNNGDYITGIKVDQSGNICISGYFMSNSIQIGVTSLTNFYTQGIENSFLAGFDTDGVPEWALSVDGMSKLTGVAVSGQNIFACGSFKDDTLHFGSSVLNLMGRGDFFVLNCDISGNPKWALKQTMGGESNESANSISADKSGNISIAGYFDSKPLTFGETQLNTTRTGFDMFVAKLGNNSVSIVKNITTDIINVFPNPCNGRFTIQGNIELSEVNLYSSMGKLVFSQSDFQNRVQNNFNLSSLPAGMYLLKLKDGNNRVNRKLIIEH